MVSVDYFAPIGDWSGYASVGRNFALALDKLGVDIRVKEGSVDVTKIITQPRLYELMAKGFGAGDVEVNCVTPQRFRIYHEKPTIGQCVFETNSLPPVWTAYCNQMDEIWVPCKFNVETFARGGVSKDKLHIVPHGVDTNIFKPNLTPLNLKRKEFAFIAVGQFMFRKGWGELLKAYVSEFTDEDDITLIIKSYLFSDTNYDRMVVNQLISNTILKVRDTHLPDVQLVHRKLTDMEMAHLYNTADCFVLPSRGESWCLPASEAMACGLPAIMTNWGGQTDFINDRNGYLIDIIGLEKVSMRLASSFCLDYYNQEIAIPSTMHLREIMRDVYENPDDVKKKGIQAGKDMKNKWTWENAAKIAVKRLEAYS